MSKHVRIWALGTTALALAGLIHLAGQGWAGENNEIVTAVKKIAAAIKSGEKDAADKAAGKLAKDAETLEEVMDVLKPRKKNGIGIGKIPGQVTPDGIEMMVLSLNRAAPTAAMLKRDGPALEEMGYILAAVAEVAHHRAPTADKGKKTKKDWIAWSADMKNSAVKLAEAAKAKNAQEVKAAASKLNASCNSCHSIFR